MGLYYNKIVVSSSGNGSSKNWQSWKKEDHYRYSREHIEMFSFFYLMSVRFFALTRLHEIRCSFRWLNLLQTKALLLQPLSFDPT